MTEGVSEGRVHMFSLEEWETQLQMEADYHRCFGFASAFIRGFKGFHQCSSPSRLWFHRFLSESIRVFCIGVRASLVAQVPEHLYLRESA